MLGPHVGSGQGRSFFNGLLGANGAAIGVSSPSQYLRFRSPAFFTAPHAAGGSDSAGRSPCAIAARSGSPELFAFRSRQVCGKHQSGALAGLAADFKFCSHFHRPGAQISESVPGGDFSRLEAGAVILKREPPLLARFFNLNNHGGGLGVTGNVGEGFLEEQKQMLAEIKRQFARERRALALEAVFHAAQNRRGKILGPQHQVLHGVESGIDQPDDVANRIGGLIGDPVDFLHVLSFLGAELAVLGQHPAQQRDAPQAGADVVVRSEERRVGKECRSRW